MTINVRNSLSALLMIATASVPSMATAADEACAGVTQKCTKDKTYDKTINGSIYSCYDCKQALCKDGGNGGISGTATSSVCTEKATTFQPISLDDQARGGDTLAPGPTTSRRPGRAVDPRSGVGGGTAKFDEADAVFGKRLLASGADQPAQRDHRTKTAQATLDHRPDPGNTIVEIVDGTSNTITMAESAQTSRDHRNQSDRTIVEIADGTSNTHSAPGLQAPSALAIRNVSATALTLAWRDNSVDEFGVELYRADPEQLRADPRNAWKLVGTFQERQLDNVAGTGMRLDEDAGLSPGAMYCYRMRAYSGLRRTQVSGFSDVACAQTASSASRQAGGQGSGKVLLPGDLYPIPTNDKELRQRPVNEAGDPVAVSPGSTTTAVPLTGAECKKLGGRVVPMSLCKSFGNAACITTDQSGTTHAVCISKVVEVSVAPADDTPIISPNNRADLPAPDGNLVVAPLTSQECKGLGGTVISTNKCSALDQKTCATVDKHGVIRVACIDKVAN